jgi:hypothetical protein
VSELYKQVKALGEKISQNVLVFSNKVLCSCYLTRVDTKLEFWTQSPNSWDSTCQVHPFTPKCTVKRHGEGRKRRIIILLETQSSGYRHEL